MKRSICCLVALFGLVLAIPAQEANTDEEMRFVSEMRSRGYTDLALEYIEKLEKSGSPALKKQLPLEKAKTRMEGAIEEPDTAKRAAEYSQAKSELQQFVKANPDHARLLEAKLDIAQIAVLEARNQLSKAFMDESSQTTITPDLEKAKVMFEAAGTEIGKVTEELEVKLAKLGDPKTNLEKLEKSRLEEQVRQAKLSEAINLLDIAQTFPRQHPSDTVLLKRGDWVDKATKALEELSGEGDTSPTVWAAKAWLGRCQHENGVPKKARELFAEIIAVKRYRPAAIGYRLARYFRLLVIEESPEPGEDKLAIIDDGTRRWIRDYSRQLRTREGNGVMYLRATTLIGRLQRDKVSDKQKSQYLAEARHFLSLVERTENMFTDRARRFKIQILVEQGAFSKKIDTLTKFEDCYVRSQFEGVQANKDDANIQLIPQYFTQLPTIKGDPQQKKILGDFAKSVTELKASLEALPEELGKDVIPKLDKTLADIEAAKKIEEAAKRIPAFEAMAEPGKELAKSLEGLSKKIRDARQENAMLALERGLGLPDAASPALEYEVTNARSTLTFHYMSQEKYDEAIETGKKLIGEFPRSSQASTVAIYVLQAFSQKMAKFPAEPADAAEAEMIKKATEEMEAFATTVKTKWKNELAGNLARHQLALVYSQRKKPLDAITQLQEIGPEYPSYSGTQFMLAKLAFQAHQAGEKSPSGGSLRDTALAALQKVELPTAPDHATYQAYFLGKCQLAEEYFKDKKYKEMAAITKTLQEKIGPASFSDQEQENAERKGFFVKRIAMIDLYSLYGRANIAYRAKKYAEVTALLDPLVEKVNADKVPVISENEALAEALMKMALQSDFQTGKLKEARSAIQALEKAVQSEFGGGDLPLSLQMVMGAIKTRMDELTAKNDKAAIEETRKGFGTILADVQKEKKDDSPKFTLAVAQCYGNLGMYKKAADILGEFPVPDMPKKEKANPNPDLPRGEDLNARHRQEVMLVQLRMEYSELQETIKGMGKAAADKLLADIQQLQKEVDEALKPVDPEKKINLKNPKDDGIYPKDPATVQKALDELGLIPQKLIDSFKNYQTMRLARARMFRLNKELEKATEAMDEIMGDPKSPGWGRKNLDALVEYVDLLMETDNNAKAIAIANGVVQALARHVDRRPDLKQKYFDTYFKMVKCYMVQGNKQSTATKRQKVIGIGATVLHQLTKKYPDFGGEPWKTQFSKLLTEEPDLKSAFDALKQ